MTKGQKILVSLISGIMISTASAFAFNDNANHKESNISGYFNGQNAITTAKHYPDSSTGCLSCSGCNGKCLLFH